MDFELEIAAQQIKLQKLKVNYEKKRLEVKNWELNLGSCNDCWRKFDQKWRKTERTPGK